MSRELCCFFFNDTATTEIYTLSLHDALPILHDVVGGAAGEGGADRREIGGGQRLGNPSGEGGRSGQVEVLEVGALAVRGGDRKSTRLNSSHANISYAVFCLKKKKQIIIHIQT